MKHTLESKVAAFALGSDFIEQDIVLTKDDVPIVLHDVYLDTVTNVAAKFDKSRARNDSRFYAIDFTYDEIKSLSVTERFHEQDNQTMALYPNRFPLLRSSFRINTLGEEIELIMGMQKSMKNTACCNQPVGFYTEIKRPHFHEINNKTNISRIVLDLFAKYGFSKKSDPVIIQCFDPFELMKIKYSYNSSLTLVQLLSPPLGDSNDRIDYKYWNSLEGLRNISSFASGIGPEKDQLVVLSDRKKYSKPSEMVSHARTLNLFIHPYTFRADSLPPYVDSFDELLRIFVNEIKVDGLFTDFPDLAVDYIRANGANGHFLSSKLFALCLFVTIWMGFYGFFNIFQSEKRV